MISCHVVSEVNIANAITQFIQTTLAGLFWFHLRCFDNTQED